mgnify:CR=1 FL=1
MDPDFITTAVWDKIGGADKFLILFGIFSIGAAFIFLTSHAIIPSLVSSGHLSERVQSVRRILYLGAAVIFVAAVIFLTTSMVFGQVLGDFWARRWI